MKIKSVRIKNYKSFKDSGVIDFAKDIHALVGKNNTGKSAILDSIQCFFGKDKKVDFSDFHKHSREDVEIDIVFMEVSDAYLKNKNNLSDEDEEKLEKIKEEYKLEDGEVFIKYRVSKENGKLVSTYEDKESNKLTKSRIHKELLPEIRVIPAIRDPEGESKGKRKSYLSDLLTMLDDEMRTDIKIEGERVSYKRLNNILEEENDKRCKSISDELTKRYNHSIGNNELEIKIDSSVDIGKATEYSTIIHNTETGIETDILSCGTGYQSMIILSMLETYVDITKNQIKYILLIEEPEVYLHPGLQRKMIDTLIKISANNQVLFTTHSPVTLGKLSSDSVTLVEKEMGESKIVEASASSIIRELGIKPDDIFYHDGIIFVEGKDDQILVNKLLKVLNPDHNINVIETGGCKNLKFYASAEILLNKNYNVPVLIIRDSDGECQKKLIANIADDIAKVVRDSPNFKKLDSKEKDSIVGDIEDSILILDKYAIEDYFLDEKLLKDFYDEDLDRLKLSIDCYNCQCDKAYKNGEQDNNIERYFQPKRFIKGYPDQDSRHRENYEKSFKNKWNKLKKNCHCDRKEDGIDNFLEVRDRLIYNVDKYEKETQKSYIDKILEDNERDFLMETSMKTLIEDLENFLNFK